MKKFVTAGSLPYSVALMLCLAAYVMGNQTATKSVAIVEKGAVVLEATLDRPGATLEQMNAQVKEPIRAVLRRYAQHGYVVIDTSRNDEGDMTVTALPAEAIDITNELRAAVHLPIQQPAPRTAAVPPAAASATQP
ncbi:hypothetical protein [Paraburkholderia dioscoreae]|uniref:Uncharacterized protein n=1 Tax=Paraburkholderia dioscoreae TaxID=2604047 RepID=A0A5Q4ZQM8_9BURK|nr:hypothetical protein [Paraburkholderia dioscoreae]VVD30940.1 conserved exported protein of unknown function [Paraburkholderia dioscoreae]